MDEMSAYVAYGMKKTAKKPAKKTTKQNRQKQKAANIYSLATSTPAKISAVKQNNGAKGKAKANGVKGNAKAQTTKDSATNSVAKMADESVDDYSSDSSYDEDEDNEELSHSSNEDDYGSELSSGEEFEEYTLNSPSGSCSCSASSGSSNTENSPPAATSSRTPKKRSTGDMDDNNNKSPAVKQQKLQPQEQKEGKELSKKGSRKSAPAAAPSCPLLRLSGNAAAIKSSAMPSKATAEKRKSCPLPKKMAAAGKGVAVVKQEPKAKVESVQNGGVEDSVERGICVLGALLDPLSLDDFFSRYWESKACQVKRKRKDLYSDLVSFEMIDEMLIENHLEFTTNIDVTSYKDGVRQTHNPDGRAMPPTVWGHYSDGCSVRILNPSTYLKGLRGVCAALQEHFHCLVGANVYLTPPNSQGFAPHYDDIEAFVLQVEGRKRWRLYDAPSPNDVLARTSSGNLKQQQLSKPIFDEVLEAGDLLYFPRGCVHQAVTEQQHHSLHITLSVYQQQSYANLMEALMPAVLQNAIKHNLDMRRGLPLGTWHHLGMVHGDKKTKERSDLITHTQSLFSKYLAPTASQIDAAVDQLAIRFQHEALPPRIASSEKKRTVFGSRNKKDKHGNCRCDYDLTEQTKIRLLRQNIVRLVAQEENSLRLYYYVDNALEYCKYEANFMEIDRVEANAIKMLINSYPKYVSISSLPLPNVEHCLDTATGLWERGLLITEEPFKKN
ncbi:bifunctional lysine-specific demethylase and histidyl-hydroxylase NO66 [Drosophila grimshawi]|uniref:Bifunctional lysine-specific demethylase and histidyl-hydroxylase NO66 n=1 Tax=Drosophila grimshawi TaxID=7222 RepID=NO66_DROGR|nr:bifunctional lysine-specific demethylase and histidyl-hydroxylase NO66 [Drosophila grimshawi]B4JMQ2.1 RecName: Full=Bifunctional lysine-specific demethylase and histidyl-hydroxylase NO66; AltName: Full=Histone lysine demethylase NO66 [Drosophila grimshawi]EDV91995.1 GH24285 [Drosophila grimshawi]